MGLRTNPLSTVGDIFSEDVLKVELAGPTESYLTIIDVPGIFRNKGDGTTKEDMDLVRDLVKRFIKGDRTIILAVLPSNVDIATQEILELAEEYDPKGERTLGVLTKPDLVLEPGMQGAVCDLVLGNKRALNLGYFLVRNRGADGPPDEELDKFFHRSPWNELPADRVGIAALKAQLIVLLHELSEREFPKLIRDVNEQIRACKRELDNLGLPRQDEREQRSFLSHIARNFQDRARAALAADYTADRAFDQDVLRLITHVVNITDVFSADFQDSGHSRHFQEIGPSTCPSAMEVESDSSFESDEYPFDGVTEALRKMILEAKLDDITPQEREELGDVLIHPQPKAKPDGQVTKWISEVYQKSRGLDLGTFNPHLICMAFAAQSQKWEQMTNVYMCRIIMSVHRFIAAALRSVCSEAQVFSALWSAMLPNLEERYQMAMNQASLLIEVEQRKKPYTLNRQFNQARLKTRGQRLTELLRPKARKDTKQYGEVQYMVNLDDIAAAAEAKSNVEQMQEEIHDILYAYYNLAVDRFIDNVFQLAVDHSLLHGPDSPLGVFTQEWVIHLDPEKLEKIVGETKSAKRERGRLTKKIKELSDALKVLKGY
jgi:hypothetical protein